MTTTVNDLLSAIISDKPTDVKAAFDSVMQDKIAGLTDEMKTQAAETMFEPAVETPDDAIESDPEFDETVFSDFTDEELEAINNMSDAEWDELVAEIEAEESTSTEDANG